LNTDFGAGSALGKHRKSRVRWYDYGARFYEPSIGRWQTVDPLAERHFGITQYNYCINNPLKYIDLYGLDTTLNIKPVIIIAPKPASAFRQFIKKMEAFFSPRGEISEGGVRWTSQSAQNEPPDIAKHMEEGGSIDDLLSIRPQAGLGPPFNLGAADILKEILSRVYGIAGETSGPVITTDKEIVNSTTGPGQKTDAGGKPIDSNGDSITFQVTKWTRINSHLMNAEPVDVKVPRKDSAKTEQYYQNKVFNR